MPGRPELHRLAAARPPILDHTELVVNAGEETRMLHQIVGSARPGAEPVRPRSQSSRAGAARWGVAHRRSPQLVIAALAALAAVAGAVAAGTALPGEGARSGAAGVGNAPSDYSGAHRGTGPRNHPAVSTATVADRAAAAVAGASRTDILYSQTVFARSVRVAWSQAMIREWGHGISAREQSFSRSGKLTEDASAVVRHGLRITRYVDYTKKQWQQYYYPAAKYGPGYNARQTVRMLLGHLSDKRETRTITQVTAQGTAEYQVTLTWPTTGSDLENWPQQFTREMYVPGEFGGPRWNRVTFWLDAASYLPVRLSVIGLKGQVLASETLSWLPPDQASRAELRPAPVPAGFIRTP